MKNWILGLAIVLMSGGAFAKNPPVRPNTYINAPSNPSLVYAVQYLPPGYSFGTLTGGNPTPLSTYYTLTQAQAKYGSGIVSATTQYVDDVAVKFAVAQATSLFSTQGYTCVVLPSGNEYWDQQITYNANEVCLIGSGDTGSMSTTIFTQTMGAGTAALHVTGSFLSGLTVLNGINFVAFNSGVILMPGSQAGTAAPGGVPSGMTVPSGFYYYTGSIALAIDNVNLGVMRNVGFYNYDTPMTYLNGNVYIWDFINFHYQENNHGINIESNMAGLPNSFERMHWSGGVSANNNYNVYFGLGSSASGSMFIDNMSLDYPNVQQVYYDAGASSVNDILYPLTLSYNHIETNSVTTGTACRMYDAGNLLLIGNNIDEEGSAPVGVVCPAFYGRVSSSSNRIPGTGNGVPLTSLLGSCCSRVVGSNDLNRYGQAVILSTISGSALQYEVALQASIPYGASFSSGIQGGANVQSGSTYTLAAGDCGQTVQFTSGSAVTVTIPASIVPAAGTTCIIGILQGGTAKVSVNGSAVSAATLVSPNSYTGTSGTVGSEVSLTLTTVSSTATAYLNGTGS